MLVILVRAFFSSDCCSAVLVCIVKYTFMFTCNWKIHRSQRLNKQSAKMCDKK